MQSAENLRAELVPAVRVLQVIVFAIAFGLLSFLGVAAYHALTSQRDAPARSLTWLALGAAGVAIAMHLVVPSLMASASRRHQFRDIKTRPQINLTDADSAGWYGLYLIRTIIACAILEGAGFMLGLALMMEGTPESAAAAVVILVLILIRFPTVTRVADWIETQRGHAHDAA